MKLPSSFNDSILNLYSTIIKINVMHILTTDLTETNKFSGQRDDERATNEGKAGEEESEIEWLDSRAISLLNAAASRPSSAINARRVIFVDEISTS